MVATASWPTPSPTDRRSAAAGLVDGGRTPLGQPIRRQRANAPGTFALWSPGLVPAFDSLPTVSTGSRTLAARPPPPVHSPSNAPSEPPRIGALPGVENLPPAATNSMGTSHVTGPSLPSLQALKEAPCDDHRSCSNLRSSGGHQAYVHPETSAPPLAPRAPHPAAAAGLRHLKPTLRSQPQLPAAPPGLSRLPPLSRGFNSYEVEAASPCAPEEDSEASGSLATSASQSDEFEDRQEEVLLGQVGIRPLVGIGPSIVRAYDEDYEEDSDYESADCCSPAARLTFLSPAAVVPPLAFLPAAVYAAEYVAVQPARMSMGDTGGGGSGGGRRPASAGAAAHRREWRVDSANGGVPTGQPPPEQHMYHSPLESARGPTACPWRNWNLEPSTSQAPLAAESDPFLDFCDPSPL
ncbi:unnamed protein product [Polarella glacialis]|uniref:Uncharacterized protein n=1 Tax=Polarella glacialis TaxID=89957 RepID=A0A813D7G4_POLGL|nr:unnamed protein product [Polarella glacialis]